MFIDDICLSSTHCCSFITIIVLHFENKNTKTCLHAKPDLHAPFEDAKGAANREGLLRVPQPQHILTGVQALVYVGMALELEACVLASADLHLQLCIFFTQYLQRSDIDIA